MLVVLLWLAAIGSAHATPPFRRLDDERPRFYEFGKLRLPSPVITPVRAAPARRAARTVPRQKTPPPPRPKPKVKEVPRPSLPPVRTTEAPTEESSTFGVSLRLPLANALVRFVGSVQTLVPVENDKEVLDRTLTARHRPKPTVEADFGMEMRAGDFLVAAGVGHGSSKAMGFGLFCIFSYQPKTRGEGRVPTLVVQDEPKNPIRAEGIRRSDDPPRRPKKR